MAEFVSSISYEEAKKALDPILTRLGYSGSFEDKFKNGVGDLRTISFYDAQEGAADFKFKNAQIYTPEEHAAVLRSMQNNSQDAEKMKFLRDFAVKVRDYEAAKAETAAAEGVISTATAKAKEVAADPLADRAILKGKGFSETLLAHTDVVADFMGGADKNMAYIMAVQAGKPELAANAAVEAPRQSTPPSPPAPVTPAPPNPAKASAPSGEAQAITELVIKLKTAMGYPPAELNGTVPADFKARIQAHLKTLEEKTSAYDGARDGVYSETLQHFALTYKDPKNKNPKGSELQAFAHRAGQYIAAGGDVTNSLGFGPTPVEETPVTPVVTPSPSSASSSSSSQSGSGGTPVAASGTAGASTGGAARTVSNPDNLTPQDAAALVQRFLIKIGTSINTKTAEMQKKSGTWGMLFFDINELPVPEKEDGNFNEQSQESFQAIMKALQPHTGLTDEEIYNYTPAVGEKLLANYEDIAKTMSAKDKAELGGQAGLKKLIDALNMIKMPVAGQVYQGGVPLQFNELGTQVIGFILEFFGSRFPKVEKWIDGIVRNATHGWGLRDLMKKNIKLSDDLEKNANAGLTLVQRTKQDYLDMWGEIQNSKKDGQSPEDLWKEFEKKNLEFLEKNYLPFGSAEDKAKLHNAYKLAFEAARARGTDTQAAAADFADTFHKNWQHEDGRDLETGLTRLAGSQGIKVDPAYQGFKADNDDINAVKAVFDMQTEMDVRKSVHQPIFFKTADGKMWVAGAPTGNLFKVEEIIPEAATALFAAVKEADQTKTAAALAAANPAFALMVPAYLGNGGLPGLAGQVANIKSWDELNRDVRHKYNEMKGQDELQKRQIVQREEHARLRGKAGLGQGWDKSGDPPAGWEGRNGMVRTRYDGPPGQTMTVQQALAVREARGPEFNLRWEALGNPALRQEEFNKDKSLLFVYCLDPVGFKYRAQSLAGVPDAVVESINLDRARGQDDRLEKEGVWRDDQGWRNGDKPGEWRQFFNTADVSGDFANFIKNFREFSKGDAFPQKDSPSRAENWEEKRTPLVEQFREYLKSYSEAPEKYNFTKDYSQIAKMIHHTAQNYKDETINITSYNHYYRNGEYLAAEVFNNIVDQMGGWDKASQYTHKGLSKDFGRHAKKDKISDAPDMPVEQCGTSACEIDANKKYEAAMTGPGAGAKLEEIKAQKGGITGTDTETLTGGDAVARKYGAAINSPAGAARP